MTYGTAVKVFQVGEWTGPPKARVVLDYEARFLRRKRLVTGDGGHVLVDLARTVSLDPGCALQIEGGVIEVVAAEEPLLKIKGDLVRLAWHIGNRHTPCQVEADHLLIRADHVLADMLAQLRAEVTPVEGPFRPEGGAYGFGRTHGHSHGLSHGHSHGPGEHAHGHDHGHDH